VRNSPPSGARIDDYVSSFVSIVTFYFAMLVAASNNLCIFNMKDRIALDRCKEMAASKGKPFLLQHCLSLVRNGRQVRRAFVKLDDDEDDVLH
jgi:hypothetical protein